MTMQSELTVHIAGLLLQLILVLAVFFGGAKWFGKTTQILETLVEEFRKHEEEDREIFDKLREEIVTLKVKAAAARK
jgi:H+/gluconate symporter-like permease